VGDDVIAKRNALIAVCESPGQSQLVHPTLGTLTVSLLDFATIERWDQGRVFELNFVFIESGQRSFPAVEISTSDDVSAASILADIAAQADFVSGVASTLRYGSAVIKQASSTATSWGALATRLSNDATGLCNTVGALQGSYGRYFGGRSINALTGIKASTATVSSLISQGVVARATVASAVNNLISSATGLGS
jgi:prophage DNA circulation protein